MCESVFFFNFPFRSPILFFWCMWLVLVLVAFAVNKILDETLYVDLDIDQH